MRTFSVALLVLLAGLAGLPSLATGQDAPSLERIGIASEAAVVRIGGCTGVCVHPRGLVLSVKHCNHAAEETVVFTVGRFTARRVYVSTEVEGPVVFDCQASDLPWASVAEHVPPAGSLVFSIGWPQSADGRQRRRAEGRLLRGQPLVYEGSRLLTNAVDFGTGSGWSGGPLFNAAGEVIGLLHGSDGRESYFLTFADTRAAYDAVAPTANDPGRPEQRPEQRPELLVFTTDDCVACQEFHRDYREDAVFRGQLDREFRVVPVDPRTERQLAARHAVRSVPTFVASGRPPVVGYHGKDWLLAQLMGVASDTPLEYGAPPAGKVPAAQPAVDWSDVEVVVLAARQPVDGFRGRARGWMVEAARGPLRRRVAEASGGRASLTLLAERTQPMRFESVCRAAGVLVEKLCVLVLVREQPLGLKGLIAEPIETLAAERLAGAPVELIFERAHPEDYAAVRAALLIPETTAGSVANPARSDERSPSDPDFPAGETALGGLLAMLTERVRPLRRLVAYWQRRRT